MPTQLDPTTFGYQNFYSATLTSDIAAGTLTIPLDTVPTPTAGILVIDPDSATSREVILYTSKGVSNVVSPSDGRGWDGSVATSHLAGTTVIMGDVADFFRKIASGELSTDPLRGTLFFDHVASGGTVALSAGLVGTFANIVFYQGGARYALSSIPNKTYTASRDTYVDVVGASGGAVTVTYTEVANNAASPALATNNTRVAIVTTSGAAITNVNQGEPTQVIPIASSTPYAVTDSLGNLICPRDPLRRLLGYRQVIANVSTTGSNTQITGLSVPVIVPTGRKVRVTLAGKNIQHSSAVSNVVVSIWDGTTGSGTQIAGQFATIPGANYSLPLGTSAVVAPSSASKTYNGGFGSGTATATLEASSTFPLTLVVELD